MSKITPGLVQWDGNDLWHMGESCDSATDKHDYTGISTHKKLTASPVLQENKRFIALAWNAFVSTSEKLGVDPVELAEALGDGRMAGVLCRNDIEVLGIREVCAVTGTARTKQEPTT